MENKTEDRIREGELAVICILSEMSKEIRASKDLDEDSLIIIEKANVILDIIEKKKNWWPLMFAILLLIDIVFSTIIISK